MQPEPRTWTVTYPPEPGPEVRAVRDGDGDIWWRDDDRWRYDDCRAPWREVFQFGDTVTDATHETTQETTDG